MMIHQENDSNWPAKYPYQELASASAADQGELLQHAYMMAQGGETADSKEPVRSSPPQSQPHGAPRHRGRRSQPTILVIDDEEPVRETLVELLSISGYRVVTAGSVGEAEEIKQRLGAEGLHLVITDIHLTPGCQVRAGYALAQRWRMQHPGLPIILISGDSSNQDLPEVRDGSLRFLLKPFQMETFLGVVREVLGR
jgi:CheY-like chemotaxis protein